MWDNYLSWFKRHIKKIIDKKFPKIFENRSAFAFPNLEFDFGIGLWLSFENYISKVGFLKARDLIFMGESVNNANALAKLASRNHRKSILMNNAFKINLNNNFNGFHSFRFNEFNELLWECD